MSVGVNIRKRRYELRMSQQELADAMGYKTRSTIAKIESGENDVSQKKLRRFAEVLETTVEALVSEISGLFAGGELDEAEKDAIMAALNRAYWDAKEDNKKYASKTKES